MSRPRLIETEKFLGCRVRDSSRLENFLDVKTEKILGCRDRDSSRLENLMDFETETSQDWAKDVNIETPTRLSLISVWPLRHLTGIDLRCITIILIPIHGLKFLTDTDTVNFY